MVTGNVFGRYGQAANTLGAAGQMDQQTANQMPQIDPYARALGSAAIGSGISGNLTSALGNTWQGAQQMAGNVASYNSNAIDSRYNSYMNNQAALQSARMQSGALGNAGSQSMWGGIIQGGMGLLGGALGSFGGPIGSSIGSSAGSMFGKYAASRMP
jgi:hypothetical protein